MRTVMIPFESERFSFGAKDSENPYIYCIPKDLLQGPKFELFGIGDAVQVSSKDWCLIVSQEIGRASCRERV